MCFLPEEAVHLLQTAAMQFQRQLERQPAWWWMVLVVAEEEHLVLLLVLEATEQTDLDMAQAEEEVAQRLVQGMVEMVAMERPELWLLQLISNG
jgi:hypothetical protein